MIASCLRRYLSTGAGDLEASIKSNANRLYPGLDGAFWHGVLDRGATLDGVFLATKPPRFVWCRHFQFRDVPPPYSR